MKGKKLILTICIAVCAAVSSFGAEVPSKTYFPYPVAPDTLATLQQRTDYIVTRFWDRCDLKRAFSAKNRMAESFADYLSFMPYASRDTVFASMDRLAAKLAKQPDDLLFLAECAERELLGDSAQYVSEELFLHFAKEVIANKKIPKASKARWQHMVRLLENSMPGNRIPAIPYETRGGEQRTLAQDSAKVLVVLYLYDPDCVECSLAKVRLNTDTRAGQLLANGAMKVVCLTPSEPTGEWRSAVERYPEAWTVGAAPDLDDMLMYETLPTFYVLDGKGKIYYKNLNVDQVLQILSQL